MNRYSFSGNGSVLIKAGTDGKYGTKNYKKNEPVVYFNNVSINILFSNSDKMISTGAATLTGTTVVKPSILEVSNIKTTDASLRLLYKKEENKSSTKSYVKSLESVGGVCFIPVSSDEVLKEEIFVYDDAKNKIDNFTVDANNSILGLTNGTYTIFYSVVKNSHSSFILENASTPNMSAEIQVKGNLNGLTGDAVIHISKIKLFTLPYLDFNSDTPFTENLTFLILNDGSEGVEIFYYG